MALEFRNPKFTKEGRIDIELNHPEYGWIPFTADPDDVEQHCRDLYAAALEVGPAAYEPPPPPVLSNEEMEEIVRAERDRLLRVNVDPVVSNPLRWDALTTEQQEALKLYRNDLLDVTAQAGFPEPDQIIWPTFPL